MLIDALGVAAGVAVIATFYSVAPLKARLLALLSNVLFLAYAIFAGLWPVILLHGLLLPINLYRLRGLVPTRAAGHSTTTGGGGTAPVSVLRLGGACPRTLMGQPLKA